MYRRLREHERFVPLKYEELVERPDAAQNVLERALPLGERKHHFGDYHNHAEVSDDAEDALGGVRPISAESVGRWKRHRPRVAGQIELHGDITEDLLSLGYEQTEEWRSELAGTDPYLEKSHYEEFATEAEVSSLQTGRYREAVKRVAENVIGKRILRQSPGSAA